MLGIPASGVSVRWERLVDDDWQPVAKAVTDSDGRVEDWAGGAATTGVHRLVFGSGDYFSARGVTTFYPEVVVFEVVDVAAHHHVPSPDVPTCVSISRAGTARVPTRDHPPRPLSLRRSKPPDTPELVRTSGSPHSRKPPPMPIVLK